MNGINDEDNRRERQEQLASISKEYGPDWEARFGPDTFGCHELLDRINLIGDLVEERILGHPTCVLRAEWHHLAKQAVEALRELYQRVGREHLAEAGQTPRALPLSEAAPGHSATNGTPDAARTNGLDR